MIDASDRLSVLISAGTLVAGHMGGSEVYVRELVGHLDLRSDIDLKVLAPRGDSLTHIPGAMAVSTLRGGSSFSRLATQAVLRKSSRAKGLMQTAEVVHYPLQVQCPEAPASAASVITLHDVQHLDMPHLFGKAEITYRNFRYDSPAKAAGGIITISEFSKRRISETLGIHPSLIHVIPLGHDIPAPTLPSDSDDFILYPANAWPHKNHQRLIEAVHILRERRSGLRLILTGAPASHFAHAPSWVIATGRIPRRDLLSLYKRALCVAFPSLYEGFGLPVLEAMASGAPVAASNIEPLREVAAEAAVYFDPFDTEGMSQAIDAAIERRTELGRLGITRSREFSWARCAERHAQVYRWAHTLRTGLTV